ncbi:MAG TPA: hypothetical protein VK661_11560 [Planctomycetota bacterium]|jgi:hypothetical protein|nr:hypothetical protein [Planctomycetota bacterium]
MKALSALLVLTFPTLAAAQEGPQDPLKDIKIGDRVQLELRTGFSIQGQIISTDPKITAIEKMPVITLDVSWEYPELRGHLGVERIHIKSVKKLPRLSAAELEARDKARQEALKKMGAEDMARRARMAETDLEVEKAKKAAEKKEKGEKLKGVGADLEAKAEMIKKGAELYAKFPPSEGWGPEKAKEIAQKTITRVPATDEEREFISNMDVWLQYQNYLKEKEKAAVEEEKPAPAPKKEEAPKP